MTGPLDLDALSRLLDAYDVKTSGTLRATLIAGGRSNLTYRVDDEVSTWVVRRPPTSGLTPSAHDMTREFRVTEALQHSDVPVARAVALDPDGSLMGAPVSVVEFVTGTVVRSRDDLEALSDEQINHLSATLVDTLVRLHSVDYTALGLGDFGRPDGFVTRQVRRWAEQWNRVRSRDLSDVEQLIGKLGQRVPTTTASSLIHGDYRIDNTIVDVHSHEPLQAIVDWELSTLGDPLTDVALMCVYRDSALDDILGFPAAWTSPRWPTEHALAQRYSQLSGRDLSDWPFYIGLAHLKLAVIAEGIAHRAASTNADGLETSAAVPHLAAAGLAALG